MCSARSARQGDWRISDGSGRAHVAALTQNSSHIRAMTALAQPIVQDERDVNAYEASQRQSQQGALQRKVSLP